MILTNKKGDAIPMIGVGTYPFQGKIIADMLLSASKIGYRLFDTSDDYRGESGIGKAILELDSIGLSREDIFLQTKISDNNAYADEPLKGVYFNSGSRFMKRHSVEDVVREKVENSLTEMNTSYLDSLLIHYPFPDYFVDIWKIMIQLQNEGIVRYIGVSNFNEQHIQELISVTGICPNINEVYLSPLGTKDNLVKFCNEHGCIINTYSPLMDVAAGRILSKEIQLIADKYNKSIAQIILRWNIERGCLPLPKTKSVNRLEENFNVFDFKLSKEEVKIISSHNKDFQYIVESRTCPGL